MNMMKLEMIDSSIKVDFETFQELLKIKSAPTAEQLQIYKDIHQKIYLIKNIFEDILPNLSSIEEQLFLDVLSSLIETIELLSKNRYKLTGNSLRNSMESFAKLLIIKYQTPTKSFSNNFEKAISEICKEFALNQANFQSTNGKKFKNYKQQFLNDFSNPYQQLYWNLSDIIHTRNTDYVNEYKYLQNLIDSPFDEQKFNTITEYFLICTVKIIEILYFHSFNLISSSINPIRVEYLKSHFSFDLIKYI